MRRTLQALCAGALLTVAAVACGGGGTAPAASKGPTANGVASTPPVNTTAVGTATLTIELPTVLTAATPAPGSAAAATKRRSPAYVNPSTTSVLDIYVDGHLIPNIDGLAGSNDSVKIVATSNGVQTTHVPLYSTNSNLIVVLQWDSASHNSMLAIGEYDAFPFTAGTTVNATVSMQMNAKYLGVVDVPNESSPTLMDYVTWSELLCDPGNPSSVQFGVYPTDALGSFVAAAGYGGTSAASLTATPTGTTTVGQTAIPGIWQINWDSNCDSAAISATAPNPANAIYTDVYTTNYQNYSDDFIEGIVYAPGGHQGIWNLVYGLDNSSVQSGFYSAANTIVSGAITIHANIP